MMGDYQRSTRACAFEQLQPESVKAVRQHIEDLELGDIESTILYCCETTSELKKLGLVASLTGKLTGRFPHGQVHYTGVFVTPEWLFHVITSAKSGSTVWSAKLKDIEFREYEFGHLIEDTGFNVFGFIGRSSERVLAFIGLGPEQAAKDLENTLKDAIQKAQGQ